MLISSVRCCGRVFCSICSLSHLEICKAPSNLEIQEGILNSIATSHVCFSFKLTTLELVELSIENSTCYSYDVLALCDLEIYV